MGRILIAPSILSADFGRLAQEVQEAEAAGADWIHVDVMDGHFVPNITVGPDVVSAVRKVTRLPVDVHLMVSAPERYLERFAEAGADTLTIHVEACTHLQRALTRIRGLGKRAGVALNPHTSERAVEYVLDDLDMVLVMSVNPGYSGQEFIPSQLEKVRHLRDLVARSGRPIDIQVDGGLSDKNIASVVDAGANVIVAGVAIFGSVDRAAAMRQLRMAAAG